jgi:hypothetical protein
MSRRDVPKVSSQDTGKSERGNTGDWRMVQWVVERGIGRRRQRSVNYFPPPLSLIPCLSLPCLFFFLALFGSRLPPSQLFLRRPPYLSLDVTQ